MMKGISLVIIITLLSFTNTSDEVVLLPMPIIEPEVIEIIVKEPKLIYAIIQIESANNDSAYCLSEDAVGCLQIRRTMVRDINRIIGYKKYKIKDRWNRNKSIEMFNIYVKHYKLVTPEEISRAWNGGPRGNNKKSTIKYWNKVNRLWTKIE